MVTLGRYAHPRDTAEYVQHRVAAVGCERDLFSSDALALIHEVSAGRLRDIDRLASAALRMAAERGVGVVDRGVVNGVINRHHGRPWGERLGGVSGGGHAG